MKCRNCQGELYRVQIKTRDMKQLYERNPKMAQDAGFSVILTCAKCGHIVKAWIVNEQLKVLIKTNEALTLGIRKLIQLSEKEPKRSFMDKLLGR